MADGTNHTTATETRWIPIVTEEQLARLRAFVLLTFAGMSMEDAFRYVAPRARPSALINPETRDLVLHLVPVRAFATANPDAPLVPENVRSVDISGLGDAVARIDAAFAEAWNERTSCPQPSA